MAKIRSQQLNPNFTGSFNVSGSFGITGPLTATTFVGMLSSSAQIESEISGSTTAVSGGLAGRISIIEGNVGAQDLNTTATPTFAGLNLTNNTSITGSLTVSGDVSGSSTSTASFGHFTGDGSGLTRVFEGTAASSSISTRLTSFSDGTATLISGSSTSTGSFGRVSTTTGIVGAGGVSQTARTNADDLVINNSTTDGVGISILGSDSYFKSINFGGANSNRDAVISYSSTSDNKMTIGTTRASGIINFVTGNGDVSLQLSGGANGVISGSSTSTGSFGHLNIRGPNDNVANFQSGNRTLSLILNDSAPSGDVGVQFRAGAGDYLGLAAGGGSAYGIVVHSNSNVAIGHENPNDKLDVLGGIIASGNISGSATSTVSSGLGRISKNFSVGTSWTPAGTYGVARFHGEHNGGGTRVMFSNSNSSIRYGIVMHGSDTGTADKLGIGLLLNEDATYANASPAMTIDSSKNIGIGNQSPQNPLHVYNGTTNAVALFESGDAQGGIALKDNSTSANVFLLATGNDFDIQTGGVANRLTVKSDGNVGIGTSNPTRALDVVGDIKATGDIIAENYIVSSSVVHLTQSFSSGSTIFGDTADDVHEFIGDTISGSSTSTGSFGSLVVSDKVQGDLIISSSTNGSILKVKTTTTNGDAFAQFDTDGMTVKIGADGHSGTYREGLISVSGNKPLMLKLGSAGENKRVMFGASGGIGLGGSYALETATLIDHGIKAEGTIYSDSDISGSITSTGSFGSVHVPDKIGLGTSNPTAQLHLFRDDSTTDTTNGILIEQDGTGDAVLQFLLTGTKRYIMGIDNSQSDAFRITPGVSDISSGTIHLSYGSTGVLALEGSTARIGVGTDNPNVQLDVRGFGHVEKKFGVGFTNKTPDFHLEVHGDAFITGSISGSATSTGSFGELESTTATIPNLQGNVALSPTNVTPASIGSDARWITLDGTNYSGGPAYTVDGTIKAGHYWESNYLRHQGIANNTGHKFTVRDGSGNYLHHFFESDGNVEFVGNVSSSASSTASFGHFIGDGSGLENVFEGTAPSASISTRLTNTEATASSFIDGTAVLVSGSAISTGSFGRLEADVVEAKQFVISSSVTNMVTIDVSGSTDFGDTGDDTHRFTGSIFVQSGSISQELHTVTNSDRMFFGRSTRGIRVSGSSNISRFATDGSGNTIDLGYTTIDGNGKTVLTAVGDGIHNDLTNYWYNNNFFRVGTGGELDGANFQGLNSQYVHYDLDSLRVKGDIIATTGSLQGEVFINSPSGSSMFIGKFTGGIPVSGSDNISRYATGSDGSTVDLGFTTLDGDGNSVIVTTGDGIYVDDNNYWYTTGHFKVGSSTNQLNWNTNDLSFTGPLTASGDLVPSTHNTYDLGADNYRWANIYTADLQLSNENATPNEIDGTTGSWTIQEGEDDLYLLNRKNGKKYRFKLEEIE